MRRFLALYHELARRNGGQPNAGRYLRRWFRDAGFADARIMTSTMSYTDRAATQDWGDTYAERTLHSNVADRALEFGLATRSELEEHRRRLAGLGPRSGRVLLLLEHGSGRAEGVARHSRALLSRWRIAVRPYHKSGGN